MVNNKRKLSLEEQEFLRAEWRKQHPEEAARRDAKRKLAKEEKAKLLREKEDFEQENLVLSETPKEELSVEEYRKKIHSLWEEVRRKRERYVKERVLEDTVLSEEQKRDFRYFVTNNYDIENQVLAAVTGALLVEGLRFQFQLPPGKGECRRQHFLVVLDMRLGSGIRAVGCRSPHARHQRRKLSRA